MKTTTLLALFLPFFIAFTSCETPDPTACFQVTPVEANAPQTEFVLTNCSRNADRYEWNFGDGTNSFEANPVHTYDTWGDYTITLTAHNEDDKTDEATYAVNLQKLRFQSVTFLNVAQFQTPVDLRLTSDHTETMLSYIFSNENDLPYATNVGVLKGYLDTQSFVLQMQFGNNQCNETWNLSYEDLMGDELVLTGTNCPDNHIVLRLAPVD